MCSPSPPLSQPSLALLMHFHGLAREEIRGCEAYSKSAHLPVELRLPISGTMLARISQPGAFSACRCRDGLPCTLLSTQAPPSMYTLCMLACPNPHLKRSIPRRVGSYVFYCILRIEAKTRKLKKPGLQCGFHCKPLSPAFPVFLLISSFSNFT